MTRPKPFHALLLALLAAGCSALFGIDEPDRANPNEGTGGAAGSAGTKATGGSGNGGTNQGGEGGRETGGTAGAAGSSSGTAGMSGSGTSGEGGEGGEGPGEFPKVGESCAAPGALACAGAAEPGRLICVGSAWAQADACSDGIEAPPENCDRRTGACGLEVCRGEFTQCDVPVTSLGRCGPDGLSISFEFCTYGCVVGTESDPDYCATPDDDQVLVDRLPETGTSAAYWPDFAIPVCVHDEAAEAWSVIRDEVEGTWGRYSRVSFPGWNECTVGAAAARVELHLDDACTEDLGGVSRYGYPGPLGAVDVRICTRYHRFDRPDESQESDERVLRFITHHLFWHVLAFEHSQVDATKDIIHLDNLPDAGILTQELEHLQRIYAGKPSGSLVNARGPCVRFDDPDVVVDSLCDGSSDRTWRPELGSLKLGDDCLAASPNGALSVAHDCTGVPAADLVWQTSRMRWRSHGGRCVTASAPNLILQDCREFEDPTQTWAFEFLGSRRVRIHLSGTATCVHVPSEFPPAAPVLAACDGVREVFDTTNRGQVGAYGNCMVQQYLNDRYEVRFKPCDPDPDQAFFLSGPVEHGSGSVLTRHGDALRLEPLLPLLDASQIFDRYF